MKNIIEIIKPDTQMPHGLKALFVTMVIIVTLILAAQAYHKVENGMLRPNHIDAFDSYMKTIPKFIFEHKAYHSDRFPLPPFAFLFLAPYTLLSRPMAQAAWVLTKPFMFIPIFLLAISMVRKVGVRLETLAVILVAVAWFFPVIGDVQEGQMNLLMLLPLTIGLWLVQDQTPLKEFSGGMLIAMAICIKVTPLAFLAYFLFRRRWRVVCGILAGIGLWLFVVPAIFFSWQQNILWLEQWGHIMILPYLDHGLVKYPNGESIPEFIMRLLEHAPAWRSGGSGNPVLHYVNVINLPPKVVDWIWRSVLLLIAVSGIAWAWKPLKQLQSRRYLMEIACVGMFMLWASERTWVPHYVTLILALMAVAMIASDVMAPAQSRRRAWWALLGVPFLMLWTSEAAKIFGHQGRHYTDVIDVVLWASFLLTAVIVTNGYPPTICDGDQSGSNREIAMLLPVSQDRD